MPVKVVTDSASDLPLELAKSLGITVVPVKVIFGEKTFKDGVEIAPDDFYKRLIDGPVMPTTSAPSIGDFVEAYERVAKDADAIVSVHVSSKVSGTYNAANQAKSEAKVSCPIEVIDTFQASLGLAMVAIAAAWAANRGAPVSEVVSVANSAMGRAQCIALFDTLEFLQKGGRIGKAQALLGTILKIKPMIIVRDGEVQPLGKARTFAKGVAALEEAARGYAPIEELCVAYCTDPQIAHEIAGRLKDLLPVRKEPFVARFGPGVGTHVGPGAVGIGLLKADGARPS
ncbi:MAG: DegV family protein [SAR202 cluster bacterium]|nr:DegV family protein [SAR202 cluster bacterium]